MQDLVPILFSVAVLIISVTLHELAHGYSAWWFGDTTALRAGRLSLNPIRHLDLVGSVLLPIGLLLIGSPIVLGWAKPVPINPLHMSKRYSEAVVALAGPVANLLLAIIAGVLIRTVPFFEVGHPAYSLLVGVVVVNVVLMLFNLIPIPPLDGFHILSYLAGTHSTVVRILQKYYLFFLLLVVLVFDKVLGYPLTVLVRLIAGVDL